MAGVATNAESKKPAFSDSDLLAKDLEGKDLAGKDITLNLLLVGFSQYARLPPYY
ncbi:hypothetical protein HSBAA_22050 [Vreelandella sulfidaeris]|uniref:Uncharacterized protein n=1 Tax=Vreelandella sulfidaeris TaxID=115553 RepID=A0A455U7U3_9GAMM|nr:hypothetical protein HSBAA_22050 [Halomonas sulfidaeris]